MSETSDLQFISGVIAINELNETPESKAKGIQEIREWLLSDDTLNSRTDDDFIVKFLRCCKYDVIKTKDRILNYYIIRKKLTHWWPKGNERSDEIKQLLDEKVFSFGGRHPEDGSYCSIIRLGKYNPNLVDTNVFIMLTIRIAEMYLTECDTQICGITTIADCKGVSFSHVRHFTFHLIRDAVKCYFNAIPMRIKKIHFVHMNYFTSTLLQIAKLFLSSKMKQRLQLHLDSESLCKNIPVSCLPVEYGGSAGNVDENADKLSSMIESCKDYFAMDEKYGIRDDD